MKDLINRHIKNIIKFRGLFLLLIPGVVILIINCYLPMFGVILAFKRYNFMDGFLGSPWVGLKNFEFLFASKNAWIITRNTLGYNLVFIFGGLILSVTAAVAISEIRNKLVSKFYQASIILPNFLSWVLVSYIVYAFLNSRYGFINETILEPLGMKSIRWYFKKDYWPYILVLVNFWKSVGIGSIIYIASIAGIDEELYEAALMDGASKWQQIRHITIPMLKPVMVVLTILALGNIFRANFGLFFQVPLDSGILRDVTEVIDTYVYRALTATSGRIGMASAAGLYQSIVGAVTIIGANLFVRRIDKESALF